LGGEEAMIVVAPVDDDRLRSGIIKLALVLAWIGKRSDEVGANEYEQVNDSNTLRAIIVAENNGIRNKAHLTLSSAAWGKGEPKCLSKIAPSFSSVFEIPCSVSRVD
jgi:hypothetical protein